MPISNPILHLLLLLLLIFAVVPTTSSSSTTAKPPYINVWPQPTAFHWPTPISAPLSPSFSIILSHHINNTHLSRAITRYTSLILSERHHPLRPQSLNRSTTTIQSLTITITNPSAPLDLSTDESYALNITTASSTALLSASTPWGAIRGLETFSQLAWLGDEQIDANIIIPAGIWIYDKPLFPHRGLLLDTSRNFYPVKDILRTIRAMAHNKLNVFHWHITDSQSFPILLPSEPDLALKGSYGTSLQYTPRDIRRVVQYAMSYGIRVIPEIDAPGHTASWAEAYPDIVTCSNKFWAPSNGPALAAEPGTGQLNPLKSKTYEVVRNVLRDVAALFPDKFLHGGADEVNTACWEEDSAVKNYVKNGGTHDELLETFVNITHTFITSSLKRTAVYWEDVLLGPNVKVLNPSTVLPTETTVLQTWNNGPANTKRIVAAGYRVIVSSTDFYYLDCGFGGWVGNDSQYDRQINDEPGRPFNYAGGNGGSWCAPFKSWQRVYDYDVTYGLSDAERDLVLGGEVALWSEQADEVVLDSRLWPRASAAAESLWSGNRDADGKKRYAGAMDRLNEWRYRMVRRRIGAEPLQPLWCIMHPTMCNLVQ